MFHLYSDSPCSPHTSKHVFDSNGTLFHANSTGFHILLRCELNVMTKMKGDTQNFAVHLNVSEPTFSTKHLVVSICQEHFSHSNQ